jgi:hypothetical protein
MGLTNRGRVAKWSKEQIDKLTTLELRALLANAERLKEPEVAAICNEILDARPRGRPPVRRDKHTPKASRLVTRRKAFEMHGVSPRNRVWSRGGIGTNGTVVLTVRADEVEKAGVQHSYLLWAPDIEWAETPAGKERLEHCRIALERGAAEGLLIYGKRAAGQAPEDKSITAERVDAETVLSFQVEKRGEAYWATYTPQERMTPITHE